MKKILLVVAIGVSGLLVGCATPSTNNEGLAPAPSDPVQTSKAATPGPVSTVKQSTNEISADEAKIIALQHAGVAEGESSSVNAVYDVDDGIKKYDVEFYVGKQSYEYDINAITGEIMGYDHDIEERLNTNQEGVHNSANLTIEQAKDIALSHANLTSEQVSFSQADYEIEDGIEKYEIEFYRDKIEYNYEINAVDGQIITYEKDEYEY